VACLAGGTVLLLFVGALLVLDGLHQPARASREAATQALLLAQGVGDSALALEQAGTEAGAGARHDAHARLATIISASARYAVPDALTRATLERAAAGTVDAAFRQGVGALQRALVLRGGEHLALAAAQSRSAVRIGLAVLAALAIASLVLLRVALRLLSAPLAAAAAGAAAAGAAAPVAAVAASVSALPPQLDAGLCAALLASTQDSVCIADADGVITQVNAAFERVSGYAAHEAVGQHVDFNLAVQRGEDPAHAVLPALASAGRWQGSLNRRRRNGELYVEDATRLLLRDRTQALSGTLTVSREVTNSVAAEDAQRLRAWQASHDLLTKLPNRTLFVERLGTAIGRLGDGERGAVVMVDLDRFKGVNDTLGHGAGDELLIQAANRLALQIRESDNIARLDGDHFGLVVTPLRRDGDIERVVQSLLRCVEEPFRIEGRDLYLSACVGVALFPDDGRDAFGLIQRADHALHEAKRDGRSAYRFFEPQMNVLAARRLELETDLRKAIDAGELSIAYQPVMDVHEQRVVCVEALLRWRHPRLGPVSPAEFVPIAEDSGLISPIGRWLIERVHEQVREWRRNGLDGFRVAVNLSSRQIATPAQRRELSALIRASGPESLTVECTERLLMEDADGVAGFLDELRRAGARVALDDFGTGYCSLAYLSRFPIDVLKIDKSFVDHMEGESADFALVATIVSMGRTLGLEVIAEGVETKPQLEHLKLLGCHLVQGYYYCRPLPAAELVAYLADGRALPIAV
jgi:diguanylate cyclase (GGDEF)-like protein/PAS domain S-box-containing protein